MNLVEQLKHARRAGVPLVAIQTADPMATIRTIAESVNGGEIVCWDVVRGCWPVTEGSQATASEIGGEDTMGNPVAFLASLPDKLPERAIAFVMNAQEHITLPPVAQAVWNLRDQFKMDFRTLILLTPSLTVPESLHDDVVLLDEALPDHEALRVIVDSISKAAKTCPCCGGSGCDSCDKTGQRKEWKGIEGDRADMAVEAVTGLSAFAAEQAVAMALRPDGVDIQHLWETKRAVIEQTSGLSVDRGGETFADIGGLAQVREFGERLFTGPHPPSVVLRIEEIEKVMAGSAGDTSGTSQDALQVLLNSMEDNRWDGAIAFGPPGSGKSLMSKAMANSFDRLSLVLDLGACKGSLVGESLHPDEEIYICGPGGQNVRRMTIKQAHEAWSPGDDWYTWSIEGYGGAKVRSVAAVIRHNRTKKFMRVKTRSGRSVVVTEDHSLFRLRRMAMPASVEALQGGVAAVENGRTVGKYRDGGDALESVATSDLAIGDKIAIVHHLPCGANHDRFIKTRRMTVSVTEELMTLAGLWCGDGCLNNGMLRISTSTDEPEVMRFLESLDAKGGLTLCQKPGKGIDVTINDIGLAGVLSELGFTGWRAKARTKRVPSWVFGAKRECVAAFLRGYFSADGGFSSHSIEANSVSKHLAEDIALLLGRVGIFARLRKRWDNGSPQYRITISKRLEQDRYLTSVGFLQGYKMDALKEYIASAPTRKYRAGRVLNGVFWDEIESIEVLDDSSQPKDCYDLSVEGTERFIAGGVVVHNSEAKVRQAMKVVKAIGGQNVFAIATCNKMDSIPPELRRRFSFGCWMFDMPTDNERKAIWAIQLKAWGLPAKSKLPSDDDYSGADIRNCCKMAWRFGCDPMEAAVFLAPTRKISPDTIENARNLAAGRFLSASYPGLYQKPAATNKKVRAIG